MRPERPRKDTFILHEENEKLSASLDLCNQERRLFFFFFSSYGLVFIYGG